MKVLHLASNLGINSTAKYLATLLPYLPSRQLVIALGPTEPFGDILRDSKIEVERIRFRSLLDLKAYESLIARVNAFQPDLVHVWGNTAAIRANVMRLPYRSASTRIVIGDLTTTKGMNQFLINRIMKLAIAIRDSEPTGFLFDSPALSKANLGLPEDSQIILNAGGFDEVSQQRNAIWAFDMLRYSEPRVQLVILGDGPQRETLEEFARSIGKGDDRVHFLGIRSDVRSVLAISSAVLLTHRSGGRSFALESVASAVPVIAARNDDLGRFGFGKGIQLIESTDRPAIARALGTAISSHRDLRSQTEQTPDNPQKIALELQKFYESLCI